MKELEIVDLFENSNEDTINNFIENTNSSLKIQTDYEELVKDTKWIDLMKETIPYIDNIFRNPNRFIVNEEEIVKIELARKITVDSIKHLTKNTNFIQEIDKKTGDVRPSKILNINKEESYDTYENRLIYTLIQNMKIFLNRRKTSLKQMENVPKKDDKKIEYTGTSKIANQKVNLQLSLNTTLENEKSGNGKNEVEELLERIQELEERIIDITCSEVYKTIDKKHISLVTSPIKKTNVILKNVNFQYAIKLWNFLQENFDDKTKNVKEQKNYEDEGQMKKLADETFLMNYLILKTLDKKEESEDDDEEKIPKKEEKQLKEKITNNMLEKLIELNQELTEEELRKLLSSQFEVVKYKNLATLQEIQKIYKKHIDKYLEKIN